MNASFGRPGTPGPARVQIPREDGSLVPAPKTGDIGPDGKIVNPAGLSALQRLNVERTAALRAAEIQALANLIREVSGDSHLLPVDLAEALVRRGVTYRPRQ
ncbi:hypothetical protein [Mycobacteroides chelonae]|uniref:hypothetical protein n=1 Tax=Mycobacteroides chelonae TaxID=1774 RepID=UPI002232532B|nr:hypothetical protein [Mycobacteroides chelonae]